MRLSRRLTSCSTTSKELTTTSTVATSWPGNPNSIPPMIGYNNSKIRSWGSFSPFMTRESISAKCGRGRINCPRLKVTLNSTNLLTKNLTAPHMLSQINPEKLPWEEVLSRKIEESWSTLRIQSRLLMLDLERETALKSISQLPMRATGTTICGGGTKWSWATALNRTNLLIDNPIELNKDGIKTPTSFLRFNEMTHSLVSSKGEGTTKIYTPLGVASLPYPLELPP